MARSLPPATRDFDLIISDIAMPVTDGYEMMRQFRQASCRFVPAIALTACVAPDDIAAARSPPGTSSTCPNR